MHELNVLMEVVDQVEALATKQQIEKVAAIVTLWKSIIR